MTTFAQRIDKVDEYYFSKKLEQIAEMRTRGLNVINLGIGSPDMPPPHQALEAAKLMLSDERAHGYATYRSSPELRLAISKWYQETYQVQLDANTEVLPLLGSKEGIFYFSMAMLNPGDQVLCPNPGYLAYSAAAKLAGADVVYYELDEKNNWLIDLELLKTRDLSKCKLMWVNYPHMPTGASCDLEFFKKLVDFAKSKNIVICNDNPYSLVLNDTPPLSLLSVDPKRENVVELNSLSKSFNMPGWRVGMLLASKKNIDATLKVKSNVDSGMFMPLQKGAIAALSVSNDWHLERNRLYRARREIVFKIFERLSFQFHKNQVGLFVWAKAPDFVQDVQIYCDELLEKCHVFITPGFIFGSQGRRYARASLCASEEVLLEALKRVERFVR